jgi:predicted AAA+ superfamily ATPase
MPLQLRTPLAFTWSASGQLKNFLKVTFHIETWAIDRKPHSAKQVYCTSAANLLNYFAVEVQIVIRRLINLDKLIERKSCFLFGPRGTGKTFLIRHQRHESHLSIDLLKSEVSLRLKSNPSLLEGMLDVESTQKVIIDEIQREPILLNEVHRLIEEKGLHFLLTGSSARKLKTILAP